MPCPSIRRPKEPTVSHAFRPQPRATAPRRRRLRALALVALGMVALAIVATIVVGRASLPQTRGTAPLPGLAAPVEVMRDAAGVPHITAETDGDALRALGYVHAQDRLWQMEWQRRVGAGRLSELVGEDALDIDRFLRTLGTYRAAEADYALLGDEARGLLDAYVEGVNAFLASGRPLPPEFLLLRTRPEPWRAADSLVWAKMMAWNLGGNWDLELLRAWLDHRVGIARATELLPDYPADGPTILGSAGDEPNGAAEVGSLSNGAAEVGSLSNRAAEVGNVSSALLGAATAAPRSCASDAARCAPARLAERAAGLLAIDGRLRGLLRLGGPGVGSNGWVVAGRLTASGLPLLANDPHLGTQIPSQWYLTVIHGDRLHVVGGTLPGLPGVVVGRNARLAWGFTNVGADVQDLYVERLDPDDPSRAWDGGWQPLTVVTETINVRGRDAPVVWAARASRHGPLVSDALDERPPIDGTEGYPTALALRWTALDPGDRTLEAFLGLDRATDWASFQAAARGFTAPSQNVVYADVDGHIGYLATGRIPRRAAGDGLLPVPGWTHAFDWLSDVPEDAMPRAFDPPSGWIVTANQRITHQASAPLLTTDWALPYRAARIEAGLRAATAGGRPLTADDMAAIQLDTGSLMALALRDALVQLPAASPRQAAAIAIVADWDGDNRIDDVAPLIVQAWLLALVRELVTDDLDDARLISYLTLDDLNHRNAEFALLALARDDGSWCDDRSTPARESCDAIALRALDAALNDLAERLGPRIAAWRWGRVHRTQFAHQPLSEVALLRPLVHRSIAAPGDAFSPNVGPPSWERPFEHDHAAGYREVLDLGAPTGRFSLITGQSGHPLSRHYADRIRPHRDGEYLSLTLERPSKGAVLRLIPSAGGR